MTTKLTDRKARWRKKHPARDRKRRDLDNQARNFRKKKTGRVNGRIECGVRGCTRAGQLHHTKSGRMVSRCRQCHQKAHNRRGDGPGSNGPGRKRKRRK